eukprot:198890_1
MGITDSCWDIFMEYFNINKRMWLRTRDVKIEHLPTIYDITQKIIEFNTEKYKDIESLLTESSKHVRANILILRKLLEMQNKRGHDLLSHNVFTGLDNLSINNVFTISDVIPILIYLIATTLTKITQLNTIHLQNVSKMEDANCEALIRLVKELNHEPSTEFSIHTNLAFSIFFGHLLQMEYSKIQSVKQYAVQTYFDHLDDKRINKYFENVFNYANEENDDIANDIMLAPVIDNMQEAYVDIFGRNIDLKEYTSSKEQIVASINSTIQKNPKFKQSVLQHQAVAKTEKQLVFLVFNSTINITKQQFSKVWIEPKCWKYVELYPMIQSWINDEITSQQMSNTNNMNRIHLDEILCDTFNVYLLKPQIENIKSAFLYFATRIVESNCSMGLWMSGIESKHDNNLVSLLQIEDKSTKQLVSIVPNLCCSLSGDNQVLNG